MSVNIRFPWGSFFAEFVTLYNFPFVELEEEKKMKRKSSRIREKEKRAKMEERQNIKWVNENIKVVRIEEGQKLYHGTTSEFYKTEPKILKPPAFLAFDKHLSKNFVSMEGGAILHYRTTCSVLLLDLREDQYPESMLRKMRDGRLSKDDLVRTKGFLEDRLEIWDEYDLAAWLCKKCGVDGWMSYDCGMTCEMMLMNPNKKIEFVRAQTVFRDASGGGLSIVPYSLINTQSNVHFDDLTEEEEERNRRCPQPPEGQETMEEKQLRLFAKISEDFDPELIMRQALWEDSGPSDEDELE